MMIPKLKSWPKGHVDITDDRELKNSANYG